MYYFCTNYILGKNKMTKLSVNINKIATLRNARGGNVPNVLQMALDCIKFGAQGITVHPRPDERHIRYQDVRDLSPVLTEEFNIEGNPNARFLELVKEIRPAQVTMVPDAEDALTSNAGWDTIKNQSFLSDIIDNLKGLGIRTSIFIGTDLKMIDYAAKTGADRIELYTEPYAAQYAINKKNAIAPFIKAAKHAKSLGLEINAGHDLSLDNLGYFIQEIPFISEVSIGHALISEALYMGMEKTIKQYRETIKR